MFGQLGRIGRGFGRLGYVAPCWRMSGASLDLDFTRNLGYALGSPYATSAALLTTTRSSSGDYADNSAGVWSSFATNIPRITDKGLLVEEARTNSIRNNSMQGAVPGTPGTLPTNWSVVATGITVNVVGAGTVNGIDYIDLSFAGTTGATFGVISFDTTTGIAATTAQVWTESQFVSVTNATNVSSIQQIVSERTGAGTFVRNDVSTIAPTSSLARFSYAATLSGGGTVGAVQPGLLFNWSAGVAVSFTVRIGWPQLELGAFATSPIRTTSAAATKAADAITTAYSGSGSGSVVVYARTAAGVGTQTLWCWDDGTSSNRIRIYRNSSNEIHCVATVSSVDQCDLNLGTVAANTAFKVAFAWAANDFAATLNGGTVGTDASGSVPGGLTTIRHGSDSGGNYWNGLLTREGLFAARVASAQLQALTA